MRMKGKVVYVTSQMPYGTGEVSGRLMKYLR